MQNLISGDPLIPNSESKYDLVYVNWRNGTDWLQRNELVLEAVIRWVNANKQPDLTTGLKNPNVVLGSSMGGVIARMALGRMDRGGGQNGAGGYAAHQTNLYVSLDAPHQGANVPLGYQAAARHATRMYVSTGGLAVAVEIIQLLRHGPSPLLTLLLADQPASRQMLNNRIDINYNLTNEANQQFLQELRTKWAYPVNIRNIAISNGSECAIDQEFAAGSTLLYHSRSTKTRFIGDLIFMLAGAGLQTLGVPTLFTIPLILPGSSKFELTLDIKSVANGGGNTVYYGNIKLTKKILWLVPVTVNIANKTYKAPAGMLPYDTYPGSFIPMTLANQPGSVSQDWMFSYNNSFYIQRRFSFIPTTSSLDIGQGNTALTNANYLARYVGAAPPVPPFNTPFTNFTTAFNPDGAAQAVFDNNNYRSLNNEPHEGLYIRSANWLANEMNGINNVRTDCNAFCTNNTITGNSLICTSQTYTAPFGTGVTYNWSVNNTGLVNIIPNGNSIQVNRIGSSIGQTSLSVNINGDCGSKTLSIPITVGSPAVSFTNSINGCNGEYQQSNLVSNSINNGSNWQWSVNYLGSNSQITIINPNSLTTGLSVKGGGTIKLNYTDLCGIAKIDGLTVYSTCGSFRVAVSPNPVQANINISFEPVSNNKVSSVTVVNSTPLKIVQSQGKTIVSLFEVNTNNLVKQWNHNESKTQNYKLNITGLKKGVYVLQVDRDNETNTTKILIE